MTKESICVAALLIALGPLCVVPRAQQSGGKVKIIKINDPVPPSGGGPDSQGDIAGDVEGVTNPEALKVVLYVHTDRWYVQPLADSPYTDIAKDGKWSSWTHLGRRYAALLVLPSYHPEEKPLSLPPVGGDVLAKTERAASSSGR